MVVVAASLALVASRGGDDKNKGTAKGAPVVSVVPAAESSDSTTPTVPPVKIPAGKEAVSISLPAVQGMAGYAKVDDRVNVYGTFKDHQPNASVKGPPLAKLILSNVQVLGVVNGGTTVNYILAVSPVEAEQVIYLASFEGIWLTLTRDGAPSVGGTPGRNAANAA
jgi:hypothetical protein